MGTYHRTVLTANDVAHVNITLKSPVGKNAQPNCEHRALTACGSKTTMQVTNAGYRAKKNMTVPIVTLFRHTYLNCRQISCRWSSEQKRLDWLRCSRLRDSRKTDSGLSESELVKSGDKTYKHCDTGDCSTVSKQSGVVYRHHSAPHSHIKPFGRKGLTYTQAKGAQSLTDVILPSARQFSRALRTFWEDVVISQPVR